MQLLDLVILVIASFADLSIGWLTYLKNQRSLTHKVFALLTVTLVGWTAANFVSIASEQPSVIFTAIKAVLFFVVLQNTCFLIFVLVYPGNKVLLNKMWLRLYLGFSALTVITCLYPGFFKGYTINDGSISPIPNPAIGLFVVHTLVSISTGIGSLIVRYRHSKGRSHIRLQFLLLASGVLLLIAPFTNFALPVLFEIQTFIPVGPLYTLAFAGLIAYSMVKHQLLDFKALVAKAFAYSLTIGFIALFYSTIVFGVGSFLLRNQDINRGTKVVYVVLAIILAISFPSIKQFFDRITNRFFYKDRYDTQAFLNELNGVLASTIELDILLRQSLEIISRNLKPEFSIFYIKRTKNTPKTIIGSGMRRLDDDDLQRIRTATNDIEHKVIITDDLEGEYSSVRRILNNRDVAVVVRLSSNEGHVGELGYLLLGLKKSGNAYDGQDIRNIDIIANELVIAIQNALRFEEIQAFNATLQSKINDATARLRQINNKLRILDEAKDEFISMASHQLRTPLTSVKGYLSMVLDGDAGKVTTEQRKLLNQAFTSSQRMVYLIADLLNVSRLRTGKFVIEALPTNLAEVVESEVSQLEETAKARNLELTYDKPHEFPALMLDETKIRQVVMNFVDNAIYYTPAGGHIQVAVRETPLSVEFTVTDDGLGVPKSEQPHLFTKFYRAGNARNARPDGTGLGLFMAKKVVIAQGGSIIFMSTEGKGSTFGFTFSKEKLLPPEVKSKK